uniref:Uncharacterized protein n=1 Tax=Siphoviridae sp. ct5jB2 TaxID=2825337 RepID=A0A8S5TTZ0_9CAUD|nr:MAG TPA: hypothetical protein [Siphoviridae sp. ct5jB2]
MWILLGFVVWELVVKWEFGIFVSHFLRLWRCFLFDFLGVFDKGGDFKFLICDV